MPTEAHRPLSFPARSVLRIATPSTWCVIGRTPRVVGVRVILRRQLRSSENVQPLTCGNDRVRPSLRRYLYASHRDSKCAQGAPAQKLDPMSATTRKEGLNAEDLNGNPLDAVSGVATTRVSGRKLPIRSVG